MLARPTRRRLPAIFRHERSMSTAAHTPCHSHLKERTAWRRGPVCDDSAGHRLRYGAARTAAPRPGHPLNDRARLHAALADGPGEEAVDRRDLTIPGSVLHPRPRRVLAPPALVGRTVLLYRFPPRLPAPVAPHKKSRKFFRSRACAACVFHGAVPIPACSKYRFSVTSHRPSGLIRNGWPSSTPRSPSHPSRSPSTSSSGS
jgi:hypothetical protein